MEGITVSVSKVVLQGEISYVATAHGKTYDYKDQLKAAGMQWSYPCTFTADDITSGIAQKAWTICSGKITVQETVDKLKELGAVIENEGILQQPEHKFPISILVMSCRDGDKYYVELSAGGHTPKSDETLKKYGFIYAHSKYFPLTVPGQKTEYPKWLKCCDWKTAKETVEELQNDGIKVTGESIEETTTFHIVNKARQEFILEDGTRWIPQFDINYTKHNYEIVQEQVNWSIDTPKGRMSGVYEALSCNLSVDGVFMCIVWDIYRKQGLGIFGDVENPYGDIRSPYAFADYFNQTVEVIE